MVERALRLGRRGFQEQVAHHEIEIGGPRPVRHFGVRDGQRGLQMAASDKLVERVDDQIVRQFASGGWRPAPGHNNRTPTHGRHASARLSRPDRAGTALRLVGQIGEQQRGVAILLPLQLRRQIAVMPDIEGDAVAGRPRRPARALALRKRRRAESRGSSSSAERSRPPPRYGCTGSPAGRSPTRTSREDPRRLDDPFIGVDHQFQSASSANAWLRASAKLSAREGDEPPPPGPARWRLCRRSIRCRARPSGRPRRDAGQAARDAALFVTDDQHGGDLDGIAVTRATFT